ncbi:MAG TPA: PH domain-containing protein [Xanthobacteraceae bacterium]|jgi:uncharacterized membrane protein YdbT with pleckstrin-like domain|nr:PH domain-containing protein [Xanthobacteraceae bacterium]
MSYVQHVLLPDERVRFATNVHWIKFVPGLALLGLAIIVFIWAQNIETARTLVQLLALVLFAIAAVMLFLVWFERWTTEIAVTTRRIIRKTGFIRRNTMEMNLDRVESVKVDQSILGRMLGYGDIHIWGTGEGHEDLYTIASAIEFRSHITAE